ncbi:MAG: toxin-antitoxin system, antitoxin component, Xre family protein [Clostridiaceae bacterium]|nr:toxin-antitoxin system, antitoxin component, Xre family protein [Clostridiaceae bacterium]
MTDTKLLREAIESRGLKYKYIAEELGITPYGLQKKIENESDFKAKEILALTRILGLSRKERDRIFFAC